MHVGKPRAIGVDRENRAYTRVAARRRPAIKSVARQNQFDERISSIVIGAKVGTRIRDCCEAVQGGKPRATGVNGEHRAKARTAATSCRPIQSIARYD